MQADFKEKIECKTSSRVWTRSPSVFALSAPLYKPFQNLFHPLDIKQILLQVNRTSHEGEYLVDSGNRPLNIRGRTGSIRLSSFDGKSPWS